MVDSVELTSNLLQQYQAQLSSVNATNIGSGSSGSGLSSASNVSSSDFGAPYVLSLSETAQQVLRESSTEAFYNTVTTISFSDAQLAELESVLTNYSAFPLDSETSASLYNDLRAGELLPSQIANAQQLDYYNTDQIILQLLGGGSNTLSDSDSLLSGVTDLITGSLGSSSDTFTQSERLIDTLVRYGELSGERVGSELNAQEYGYLDIIEQGGLVT